MTKIISGEENKCKKCGDTVNISYFPLGLTQRDYLKAATPIGSGSAKYCEWICKECDEESYKKYVDSECYGSGFMSNLILAMFNIGEPYVVKLMGHKWKK